MTKKHFIITVAVPILISIIIGIVLIILNSSFILKSRASAVVRKETDKMKSEITQMQKDKELLVKQETDSSAEYEKNLRLIDEVETLNSELTHYDELITAASSKNSELDKQIADKRAYIENSNNAATETDGKTTVLKPGDYKVPSDIAAGRYRAEGSGMLYIYTISNSLRSRTDLSTTDSHTYTFDVASGESITTEGEVTITKLES